MPQRDALAEWKVVVPSKKRSKLMPRLLSLVPHATVYVDEVEVEDYRQVVPPGHLVLHESLPTQQAIMEYALRRESAEFVLMLDDDFEYIGSYVDVCPRMKKYTDPDDVMRIIENMVNVLVDLDLYWGGWNTSPHPGTFMPFMPIAMTGVIRGAMMVRGRDVIKIDPAVDSFDLDCTLQALLKCRCLIKDMRFFWSFGQTGKNAGGHRAVENSNLHSVDRELLRKKWGSYILIGNQPVSARMSGGTPGRTESFGHRVVRKQEVTKID